MNKPPVKHNPAFLSDEELERAFVVRHDDRDTILGVIKENAADSNQHVLVIGPRGIGKTMLVRCVALNVRQDELLRQKWYPLVFAEESYEVASAGEFWLEALFHLGHQTGDDKWTRTYEDLKREPVETRLHDRALAQLMDFADSQGKRILLIVENLNMILGEQLNDDNAWKLRHTLMHEPRVMLLATATTRLDLPENTHKAMFELFKSHVLQPLNDAECQALWFSVTGEELGPRRIRAVSILTGGNPRLLAIISHFGARLSFAELMDDMTGLVDDHTDYFKSHLDALPPTERKAYVALADLWDPSTARQVALAARLGVSMTSSLLKRLVGRGAAMEVPGKGRTKRYQVAERMYNIYYLMRRRGSPSERVKAVVRFMVQFYESTELVDAAKRLTEETSHLAAESRQYHYYAFEGLVRTAPSALRSKILECASREFLEAPDSPESLRLVMATMDEDKTCPCGRTPHPDKRMDTLFEKAVKELREGRTAEAKRACQEMLMIDPAYSDAWVMLGRIEQKLHGRNDEAERAFRKAAELGHDDPCTWDYLGRFLSGDKRHHDEAKCCFKRAIEIYPDCSDAYLGLADLLSHQSGRKRDAALAYKDAEQACLRLIARHPDRAASEWRMLARIRHRHTSRFKEAEVAYRKSLELEPVDASTWAQLGRLLDDDLARYGEAETAYRKAMELDPSATGVLGSLGCLLRDRLKKPEEAESLFRKIIDLNSGHVDAAWMDLGRVYEQTARYEDAEAAYRKAIKLDPKHACPWADLGRLLQLQPDRYEDAETAFRTLIGLASQNVDRAWADLGTLHEHMGRYEEAEADYRKAIELNPKKPNTLTRLGDLLCNRLGRKDEAEQAYLKAVKADRRYVRARTSLVSLALTGMSSRPDYAIEIAQQALTAIPKNAGLLNGLAWAFYESGPTKWLNHAEEWARKAVELKSTPALVHTLACVLARSRKAPEALAATSDLLNDPKFVRDNIDDMIRLFGELLVAEAGAEVYPLLRDSKSATALEPVAVALQMHLGMGVHVAPEIAEVAKDVLKRFEEMRERRGSEREG